MSISGSSNPVNNNISAGSPIIAQLKADLANANSANDRSTIIASFWKNNKFPLVEAIPNDENNFMYTFALQRAPETNASFDRYFVADHRMGSPKKVTDDEQLQNITDTDVNHVTLIFPADVRLRYGFIEVPKNYVKDIFDKNDAEYEQLQGTIAKFILYGEPVSKLTEEARFKDPLNERKPGDTKEHDRFSLLSGPAAAQPINERNVQIDPARLKQYDIQVPLHANYGVQFISGDSISIEEQISEWKIKNTHDKKILVIENSATKKWTVMSDLVEKPVSGTLLDTLKSQKASTPIRAIKSFLDHHHYWVYLPKNHDPARAEPYPLNVFLDGKQYIEEIHAPIIHDEMTANNKIPPGVSVFLAAPEDSAYRYRTYHSRDDFAQFVTKEFIPSLQNQSELHLSSACSLTGFSLSGLTATYIGLKYPEVIQTVISQSGAFWTDPQGCSLLIMDKLPADLKKVEGSSGTAFVFVDDKLFYIDKNRNEKTLVDITLDQVTALKNELDLRPLRANEKSVLKYNVVPLQLLPLFAAVTKLTPHYKLMDAVESFSSQKATTQFILQAGIYEGPVSGSRGVVTNDLEADSLFVSNKVLTGIMQDRNIDVSFKAASVAHTADGCEATLPQLVGKVSLRQIESKQMDDHEKRSVRRI